MEKYEHELEKLNDMDKNDLRIGRSLAKGCYNEHIDYDFSIETLKQSTNNNDEMFKTFEKNKSDFWDKIQKLNERELEIYFNALREFCIYIGHE